jgi:hypothetical protein
VKGEDQRRARIRRRLPSKFISVDAHRPAPFNP